MREVELRVGRKCLTLDFVKYWFRLHECCLWYKFYTLFYRLHIGKVCSVLRPLGWYMKGFPWNFILSG